MEENIVFEEIDFDESIEINEELFESERFESLLLDEKELNDVAGYDLSEIPQLVFVGDDSDEISVIADNFTTSNNNRNENPSLAVPLIGKFMYLVLIVDVH